MGIIFFTSQIINNAFAWSCAPSPTTRFFIFAFHVRSVNVAEVVNAENRRLSFAHERSLDRQRTRSPSHMSAVSIVNCTKPVLERQFRHGLEDC